MNNDFKNCALQAITNISVEITTHAAADKLDADYRTSERLAQRLYNATHAALDLGATEAEVAAAMNPEVWG